MGTHIHYFMDFVSQESRDGLARSSVRWSQGVSCAVFSCAGSTGGKFAFKSVSAVGRIQFFVVVRPATPGWRLEAGGYLWCLAMEVSPTMQFPSSGQQIVSLASKTVLYNLMTGVHHHCHILFVRSKSEVLSILKRRGFHKDVNTNWHKLWETFYNLSATQN